MTRNGSAPVPPNADDAAHRHSQTLVVMHALERDINDFLSSKHTRNATLSVQEVMRLYRCPEARARRVLTRLVRGRLVAAAGKDVYNVAV